MERILLVEDDIYLAKSIRLMLQKGGYEATVCRNKKEAVDEVQCSRFSLCLIDLMLPDGSGFELCSEIRRQYSWPILILSACNDESSMIRGLELGADDYVTKPFLPKVLMARIQANLRRCMLQQTSQIYVCGELRLDASRQEVFVRGEELNLGTLEYRILEYFIHHAELVVKREALFAALWDKDERYVEDNTLTVAVSRLRKKVGRKPDGSEYIETIRGVGYRLAQSCRME